ncbi:hypothetical protein PF008_g29152 [Phytophthora fragariae]|uniref:Secreted protein n=1 Tax=Phytophthora fragariae TaxID=53985 RepID=A0A6G0Q9C4_9STRA|nr:hypothetical protein PF008_g29152 [Phytophthora fragariae]
MCWSTRAIVVCCLYTCAWPRQKKMQVTEIGYGLILLQYNNHHQNRGGVLCQIQYIAHINSSTHNKILLYYRTIDIHLQGSSHLHSIVNSTC